MGLNTERLVSLLLIVLGFIALGAGLPAAIESRGASVAVMGMVAAVLFAGALSVWRDGDE